ncbi:MAG: hypothetical protein ACI8ZM_005540 [Crocinitomix sp.]|jgi:hypothetical protein
MKYKLPSFGELLQRNALRTKAIFYWGISVLTRQSGIVIMCCDKTSLAAQFADKTGFDVIYFASRTMLVKNGFWYWQQRVNSGYESYLLSDMTCDTKISSRVEAGFENLAQPALLVKQRRLDEQYSSLKKINWIHCSYSNALEIILGSRSLIERDLPVITITSHQSTSSVTALVEAFSSIEYSLYDTRLQALRVDSDVPIGHYNEFVALPNNSEIIEQLPDLLRFDSAITAKSNTQKYAIEIQRYYLSLCNLVSKNKTLLKSLLFSNNQVFSIAQLAHKNFHPEEGNQDYNYCWTGPEPESHVYVNIPSPGQYHMRIVTADLPGDVINSLVMVFADGVAVFEDNVESNAIIEFDVLIEETNFSEELCLTLCTSEIVNIDGKSMGLSIHKIEVYWTEDELK